jgi:hypothetical protein
MAIGRRLQTGQCLDRFVSGERFCSTVKMNSTVITDETNGVITRVTVLHHDYFNYRWLILAMLVAALLAWGLRKIFWQKDSN